MQQLLAAFGTTTENPMPFPASWTQCFKLRVKCSHLWMMGAKDKSFGFVMICEDLCPKAQVAASPWAKTIAAA